MRQINSDKTLRWKDDTRQSVCFYNDWFMAYAPQAYIEARRAAVRKVDFAISVTDGFRRLSTRILTKHPEILSTLRMATFPPLAVDRLAGLAGVRRSVITAFEGGKLPQMSDELFDRAERDVLNVVRRLLDRELLVWLGEEGNLDVSEVAVATSVISDRLCGSMADPNLRNEQERRQLKCLSDFLSGLGYDEVNHASLRDIRFMPNATFAFHVNLPVENANGGKVNMPIDVVIKRARGKDGDLPLLLECKSAGDFANTNKRRKEEAQKVRQLRDTYGKNVDFLLFLCGYFDASYLGYEAAEGIDWVWEHRVDDLLKAGL